MALLCLPSQAGAQDMGRNVSMDNARVASPATDPQGEIIVTARRRAEKLQDVPLAVSVMTQDQLKTQQVHAQNDLQQKIPSLSVASRFGHTGGTYAIRGLSGTNTGTPALRHYFARKRVGKGKSGSD